MLVKEAEEDDGGEAGAEPTHQLKRLHGAVAAYRAEMPPEPVDLVVAPGHQDNDQLVQSTDEPEAEPEALLPRRRRKRPYRQVPSTSESEKESQVAQLTSLQCRDGQSLQPHEVQGGYNARRTGFSQFLRRQVQTGERPESTLDLNSLNSVCEVQESAPLQP